MFMFRGLYVSVKSIEKTMLDLLKFIYTPHIFNSCLKKREKPTCSKSIHTNSWHSITRCKFAYQQRILDPSSNVASVHSQQSHHYTWYCKWYTIFGPNSSIYLIDQLSRGCGHAVFHHSLSSAQNSSYTLWSIDTQIK